MIKNELIYARRSFAFSQLTQIIGALALLTLFAALTPAKAETAKIADAFESVVVLRGADNKDRFLGSGFIWGDGGLIVTNAHVVGTAQEVRVVDATGRDHAGQVIGRDPVRDVAVVAVSDLAGTALPLGPMPEPGDAVWAIGAPLELGLTLTRGVISARARQVEAAVPIRFLQHDAAVNPGSSGGPLLDALGRLIGMNSRIADGSRYYVGVSYAISVVDLERIVLGLVTETLLPIPKLGLQLRPVDREIAAALGIAPHGVLIDRVQPGTLAEGSGLRAGDIILAAAGVELAQAGDLAFAIDASLADGRMAVSVWRGGQDIVVDLGLVAPDTSVLGLRGVDGAAALNRISSYELDDLGIVLDDDARVVSVTENSPALFAGLIRTDVILAVNGMQMTVDDLRRLTITAPTLILVQRAGGATLHVILDPWDTGEGIRSTGGANVLDPAVVVF